MVTGDLTWRRLGVLVRGLPRESATFIAVNGVDYEWGPVEYLLAHVADLLAGANWQRGGGKGPRPKPLPRPGRERSRDVKRFGGSARPLSELKQALEDWSEGGDAGGG